MRKVFLAALASGIVACASAPRYYLSETAPTVLTPKADSVVLHVDERLLVQMNEMLILGRHEQLEQGGCLHVARHEGRHVWVDTLLAGWIDVSRTTNVQIRLGCQADEVPVHWHIIVNMSGQCEPSDPDFAATKVYLAAALQCGIGVDSIIAWRAKR